MYILTDTYVRYPFLCCLLYSFLFLFQSSFAAPKRELRAVWIATVGNIDWPSKQGLSAQQQQQEFINHLNFLQSHGFNAVIVQVRPAADAFYPSEYEPWSRYLSGKQGQPPFPKYDPLEFMVAECHKRNMEFHAWFNPYRALVASNSNPNPANHATRTHPDWIISYGGKSYFDPGNPEAREYILKVILDVVHRYDIDAVHIDDYFYPYPIAGKAFGDQNSYTKYSNGQSREDWRRDNVNLFVSQLNVNIKKEKSWVKFGVSPFGIWRNDNKDSEGSATRGSSCYDDLYSDVKLWIENKWVDYVAPQLYWQQGHRVANYDVLLPWWKQHTPARQLYIGLGVYNMVNARATPWNSPNEILEQIRDARQEHVNGFVFYSMSSFYKISSALSDSLQQNYFGTIAVPPAMPWLDRIAPPSPVARIAVVNNGNLIQWDPVIAGKEPAKYLVYRFAPGAKIDLENADNIMALTQANSFLDRDNSKQYQYVITALDRVWNESEKSNIVYIKN
jgi:uncharacterized lipoprotein YddW (UPF0748 family)